MRIDLLLKAIIKVCNVKNRPLVKFFIYRGGLNVKVSDTKPIKVVWYANK